MSTVITSDSNDKIKYLRKLYQKRQRKKEGKFILEGYRIVEEALKAGAGIELVFMTPDFASGEAGKEVITAFNKPDKVILINENLMNQITDTDNPQGIITIVDEVDYNLDDFFNQARLILVLDQLQDPGNMGTIIRTAVAAGVDGIIALKGCVDIYNLKVLRATMGAIFNIPIINLTLTQFKQIFCQHGDDFELIGTAINCQHFYYQPGYDKPTMLIIGNEARGMRDELNELVSFNVKIPLLGQIDSLNAAIATGILVYKIIEKKGW